MTPKYVIISGVISIGSFETSKQKRSHIPADPYRWQPEKLYTSVIIGFDMARG